MTLLHSYGIRERGGGNIIHLEGEQRDHDVTPGLRMETDECSYIGGEDRLTIVWRCVHKLFTSDCILAHTVATVHTEWSKNDL
jgi:hypothetical protein